MRISDWSSDVCSSDLVHALTSRLTPNSLIKPTAGGISRPKCRPGAQAAARCAPPPPITADSTDDLEALPRRQAAQSQCLAALSCHRGAGAAAEIGRAHV